GDRQIFWEATNNIEDQGKRANDLRSQFSKTSADIDTITDRERRDEQDKLQKSAWVLTLVLGMITIVSAFPILIGSQNWKDIKDDMQRSNYLYDGLYSYLARLIHAHSRDSQMWVYKALICMDDLVSRPSRSPDRCELRHVSAIRFPAGCPVRLAGCWRQAGGGRV